MTKTRCPHCGGKLGQYLYADACPACRQELEHNTRELVAAPVRDPHRVRAWPVRLVQAIVRVVER